jgi:serine/threonine protein kinase
MGVTYKALDVNLRCAVALKVINARFIGDESARRRFVREARAAASVRHPNVASVFHLGKSGDSYFYAMEFVDGESLDKVIRRSGRLDPSTALKVTTLVAAGLEAIDQQNLVHRDIKPSNIMVRMHGDNIANAKIIDTHVQLEIAKSGLANNAEVFMLEAYMDRRQGNWGKAIQEFNWVVTLDPRNPVAITELAHTYYDTREFRAAEQAFDRVASRATDNQGTKSLDGNLYGDRRRKRDAISNRSPPSVNG